MFVHLASKYLTHNVSYWIGDFTNNGLWSAIDLYLNSSIDKIFINFDYFVHDSLFGHFDGQRAVLFAALGLLTVKLAPIQFGFTLFCQSPPIDRGNPLPLLVFFGCVCKTKIPSFISYAFEKCKWIFCGRELHTSFEDEEQTSLKRFAFGFHQTNV